MEQILRCCQRTKKSMEHEGDGDISCNWCTWNDPQRLCKKTREVGNQRTSGNHPNYSIVKISHNTETIPGNLRRLAITQTPVKDHLLTPVGKILKDYHYYYYCYYNDDEKYNYRYIK